MPWIVFDPIDTETLLREEPIRQTVARANTASEQPEGYGIKRASVNVTLVRQTLPISSRPARPEIAREQTSANTQFPQRPGLVVGKCVVRSDSLQEPLVGHDVVLRRFPSLDNIGDRGQDCVSSRLQKG